MIQEKEKKGGKWKKLNRRDDKKVSNSGGGNISGAGYTKKRKIDEDQYDDIDVMMVDTGKKTKGNQVNTSGDGSYQVEGFGGNQTLEKQ